MDDLIGRVWANFTPAAAGIWSVFGLCVLGWFRILPKLREQNITADQNLTATLMRRINDLEQQAVIRERHCDEKLAALQAKLDGVVSQFLHYQRVVAEAIPPAYKSSELSRALTTLAFLDPIADEGQFSKEQMDGTDGQA